MRILHLVHQYPPEHIGGTEIYTRSLSRALAQSGHQVTAFYRRSAEGVGWEKRVGEKVQVREIRAGRPGPTRRFLDTFGCTQITRAFEHVLEETHPDLVHIQHLMGLPANLVHLVHRKRIPYTITLHDYWWVCPNAQLLTNYSRRVCDGPRAYANCALCALTRIEHPWLWPAIPPLMALLVWRNHLLRRILRQANHLIAPTAFVQQWYAKQGVPPQKISIIPHGIEWPIFPKNQRREPNAPLRFAYIGGLSWQKGVHVVVEAFKKVRGAELWIAGDETFDPDYVSHLREQASPNVRFLGQLPRAKMWETLTQVDAVMAPSLWYETFVLAAREAFAAGVPVLASNIGALAEAVRDGVDGLLVPPGDVKAWQEALQRLVNEPGLLAHLRSNVQPPPTLEEHVDRLESLYCETRAAIAEKKSRDT